MNLQEAIERHNCALESYIADVNRGAPGFFEREQTPYRPVIEATRAYYVFMSYVIDQVDINAGPREPLIVYAKAAETLAGLETCIRNGFLNSASMVLRGLFETEITLALLTEKDTEQRSHLYAEYEKMGRWYDMKAHEELVQEGALNQVKFDTRFPPERIKTITDDYDRVKINYHPTKPGTYGWAWKIFATGLKSNNPSLKAIAKHLGRLQQYNVLYSVLSVIAHAGSIGRKAITSKDGMTSPGPIFDERTPQFIGMGVVYCHQALTHIKAYLPETLYEELQAYSLVYFENNFAHHHKKKNSMVSKRRTKRGISRSN